MVNGEGCLRRICKRDSQELVRLSLYDTKEGCIVDIDLWFLRLGGWSWLLSAAGPVRFQREARVLYCNLHGKRVQRRCKREESTCSKQDQGSTFDQHD